jgi:hypothetical protein
VKRAELFMRPQESLDAFSQFRVSAAGIVEKRHSLLGRTINGLEKNHSRFVALVTHAIHSTFKRVWKTMRRFWANFSLRPEKIQKNSQRQRSAPSFDQFAMKP